MKTIDIRISYKLIVHAKASLASAHRRYPQEHLFCDINSSNITIQNMKTTQISISKRMDVYSIFTNTIKGRKCAN